MLIYIQSPLTIPTAWGDTGEKRASGSSPTPSSDMEPAEKRERSDSRLSNELNDCVFVNDTTKTKPQAKQEPQMQILGQDDDEFLSDDEKVGKLAYSVAKSSFFSFPQSPFLSHGLQSNFGDIEMG